MHFLLKVVNKINKYKRGSNGFAHECNVWYCTCRRVAGEAKRKVRGAARSKR